MPATKSAKENAMRKTCYAMLSLLLLFVDVPFAHAEDAALPQPVMVVISVLQLSGAQASDLVRTIREREAAIQPIAKAVQENRDALAKLLDSPGADPAKAGQIVIAIHSGEKQIEGVAHAAAASFVGTLTDDQRQRLGFIIRAEQVTPAIPAFKALGLL
jgi:uncharacterized membrane protein